MSDATERYLLGELAGVARRTRRFTDAADYARRRRNDLIVELLEQRVPAKRIAEASELTTANVRRVGERFGKPYRRRRRLPSLQRVSGA